MDLSGLPWLDFTRTNTLVMQKKTSGEPGKDLLCSLSAAHKLRRPDARQASRHEVANNSHKLLGKIHGEFRGHLCGQFAAGFLATASAAAILPARFAASFTAEVVSDFTARFHATAASVAAKFTTRGGRRGRTSLARTQPHSHVDDDSILRTALKVISGKGSEDHPPLGK
ncbi:unnamed protein product [Polarella glacialis]|uniref:Uncharacterized protein n=1 Tax=Polarella glacialis TaxID=89957 RepID=A0A813GFF4_POLGL|nr:unnamed protein product [Polarella glacialis]